MSEVEVEALKTNLYNWQMTSVEICGLTHLVSKFDLERVQRNSCICAQEPRLLLFVFDLLKEVRTSRHSYFVDLVHFMILVICGCYMLISDDNTKWFHICLLISCWPRFATLYKPVGDDLHTSACLWTLMFPTSCSDSISEVAIATVWPSRMPATSSGQPIWNNLWLKMSHQSKQDLVKFCRILGGALNWVSLSNRMPTRAWGILMDFILLCLLLSYVDFFFPTS